MVEQLTPAVWITLAALFGVLVLASAASRVLRAREPKKYAELGARIVSWWVMVSVFALALLLGRTASIVYFGVASFIALKEYLTLVPTRRTDRRILLLCYLAIPLQFYWVAIGWYGMFIIFIPVYMFLLLPAAIVLGGHTEGYLKAVGTLHWGLMTCVFAFSHAAYLLALPAHANASAGPPGLLLALLILTEGNDVSQYVWGRAFGRIRVAPQVSPKKTLAGLLGGILSTTILSAVVCPFLTPYGMGGAAALGAVIGAAGFIGDIAISAIKRDIGVKDMGSLLPGHGGVLDRIDSLTYTAPLFFHITYYLFY
jgi:phosphatidate cytidylyltransferase